MGVTAWALLRERFTSRERGAVVRQPHTASALAANSLLVTAGRQFRCRLGGPPAVVVRTLPAPVLSAVVPPALHRPATSKAAGPRAEAAQSGAGIAQLARRSALHLTSSHSFRTTGKSRLSTTPRTLTFSPSFNRPTSPALDGAK